MPAAVLSLALLFLGVAASSARAAVEDAVDALLPRLSADAVEDRYAAQIALQDLALESARPGMEAERAAVAKVLAARAVDAEVAQSARVWIVRQLEHIGRAEAVPALTQLLGCADGELREVARRALEKNASPTAAGSLRTALKEGGDVSWRVGLISSLGERRDAAAVPALAAALGEKDLAAAAAAALGKIATPAAQSALRSEAADRGAADRALIGAGERLLAAGDRAGAQAIFASIFGAGGPSPLRAAALSGLVRADPGGASGRVVAALKGGDPRLRGAALAAAAAVDSEALEKSLAGILPDLAAGARAQVIGLLGPASEVAVIEEVSAPDPGVRMAALEALGRIGGATSLPVIFAAAAGEDRAAASIAARALAEVGGDGTDAAIRERAAEGPSAVRAIAIAALADRHDRKALDDLLEYAAGEDGTVANAAYRALRQIAAGEQIHALAKLVLATGHPGARAALKAAAGRCDEPEAAATRLLALGGPSAGRAVLLEAVGILGGEAAFKALVGATGSGEAEIKDAAVRALGDWDGPEALPVLLKLAGDSDADLAHHALAIRGITRLVKEAASAPAEARAQVALDALKAARRAEEKRQVLSALGTIPHPSLAGVIQPLIADPELQREAALAALALAEKLAEGHPETAKGLAQAVREADLGRDLNRRAGRILGRRR